MKTGQEDKFEESIKELARKEFSTNKRDDASYRKLCIERSVKGDG